MESDVQNGNIKHNGELHLQRLKGGKHFKARFLGDVKQSRLEDL